MKFALNIMFVLATLFCFVAGALYLQSKDGEKYVEIYSNEHV